MRMDNPASAYLWLWIRYRSLHTQFSNAFVYWSHFLSLRYSDHSQINSVTDHHWRSSCTYLWITPMVWAPIFAHWQKQHLPNVKPVIKYVIFLWLSEKHSNYYWLYQFLKPYISKKAQTNWSRPCWSVLYKRQPDVEILWSTLSCQLPVQLLVQPAALCLNAHYSRDRGRAAR